MQENFFLCETYLQDAISQNNVRKYRTKGHEQVLIQKYERNSNRKYLIKTIYDFENNEIDFQKSNIKKGVILPYFEEQ